MKIITTAEDNNLENKIKAVHLEISQLSNEVDEKIKNVPFEDFIWYDALLEEDQTIYDAGFDNGYILGLIVAKCSLQFWFPEIFGRKD